MRVLICGERTFNNKVVFYELIGHLLKWHGSDLVIIHGGARGADQLAGDVAMELGIPIEVFPANWKKYGRAAGPIRNKQILEEGKPNFIFAFFVGPFNKTRSKGTTNMVQQARVAGRSMTTVIKCNKEWTCLSDYPLEKLEGFRCH